MNVKAFLVTIEEPRTRARAEAALMRQMRWDGRYAFRSDEIERRIAAGATIELSRQGTRRLVNPSGSFLDEEQITKTAMDYAAFLLAKHEEN